MKDRDKIMLLAEMKHFASYMRRKNKDIVSYDLFVEEFDYIVKLIHNDLPKTGSKSEGGKQ